MNATRWVSAAAVLWVLAGVTRCGAIQTGLDTPTPPFVDPDRVLQLAGDVSSVGRSPSMSNAERRQLDSDSDSDELPIESHKKRMPGERAGASVTSSPTGYDAKHLSRLWGRFTGVKVNPKEARQHVPKGGGAPDRVYRWH